MPNTSATDTDVKWNVDIQTPASIHLAAHGDSVKRENGIERERASWEGGQDGEEPRIHKLRRGPGCKVPARAQVAWSVIGLIG